MTKEKVQIFTDGACRGNPGIGGWGALLRFKDKVKKINGAEDNTTNNRMELTAAIKALEALKQPCEVILTTDSEYLRKGMLDWLANWKRRGWITASKQPVKNKDLWQRLDELSQNYAIEWRWVKGHSGHPENELADQLANEAIDKRLEG